MTDALPPRRMTPMLPEDDPGESVTISGADWEIMLDEIRSLKAEAAVRAQCEAEIKILTRERDLAIAHDRRPYPTAWAYEQLCKAHAALKDKAEADAKDAARHYAGYMAYKGAYLYLQARMESIGRHGWAHDQDGEIEHYINAAIAGQGKQARDLG